MTKPKSSLAPLPRTEILVYWVLSFGSHLYSFYQLHQFSKEHKVGLERDFHLEEGLLQGYHRDSSDFEWSFWTEWAKKSLLGTLLGHGVISRLTNVYYPKRDWYETEEEYYLLLFSVAVCGLRFISFSLEHCWSPLDGGAPVQLFWLFSYTFYHPFFYNGPIVLFKDYTEQMQRLTSNTSSMASAVCHMVLTSGRIVVWWFIAECMIHLMYMHSIQSNETYIEILPPWALGGLALALVQFFYVKYLVLFGLPSMLASLDKLVPPKLPRCVSVMCSFTGMWRHFDEGLYRWLIRYIYVPLGGSRHGPLYKMFSTGLAFGLVCLWHGGHDYLQCWALMNWAGVLVEHGFKAFLTSSYIYPIIERRFSAVMRRRCVALLSAFSTAMLILSNLLFLGGMHVGRIFWKRVLIQGWSTTFPPMLAFLYCFAQVGLEQTSHPP
ncbi:protein-cysteine N-palmitoyltransferase HHAT isoform X2 [Gouania willdenowi]|uniref:protein-cysteine N-palmitoyltransferase HHAT isoform X2 n=1 Tax=Gouania willdenowi TaxID=441366 RepID=UPI001056001C|nr:protein-cysteine N-palmitoyltransferase HHAT isoform X2 [Gouania willdenowi]